MRKELQTPEEFESMLREEIEVSSEFGLPLGAIVIRPPDSLDDETTRRLLDELRLADLVSAVSTAVSPGELVAALPNTSSERTRVVAERLRAAAPGTEVGDASYAPGDTVKTLVGRARRSLS